MKQLTCEMCGSTDLIKEDGVFICQACGIKYSVEEAKKMMIDDSTKIDNYYMLAETAFNIGKYEEAENYCKKILEIDSTHYKALFLEAKRMRKQFFKNGNFFSSDEYHNIEKTEGYNNVLPTIIKKLNLIHDYLINALNHSSKSFISEIINEMYELSSFFCNQIKIICTGHDDDSWFDCWVRCGGDYAFPILDCFCNNYKNNILPLLNKYHAAPPACINKASIKLMNKANQIPMVVKRGFFRNEHAEAFNKLAKIKYMELSITLKNEEKTTDISIYRELISLMNDYKSYYYRYPDKANGDLNSLSPGTSIEDLSNRMDLYSKKIKELTHLT